MPTIEFGVLCIVGKSPTTGLDPQPLFAFLILRQGHLKLHRIASNLFYNVGYRTSGLLQSPEHLGYRPITKGLGKGHLAKITK